jgi:filamentous hemagglutinin
MADGLGHSVFGVARNQVLGLLDEVWLSSSRIPVVGDPVAFITPMGRAVGTAGESSVRLIVKSGTTNVISAYPVVWP